MSSTRTNGLVLIAALTSLTALAGCSAASEASSSPSAAVSQAPSGAPGQGQPGGNFPGVTGLIAEVQDKTLQVQGQDGQTAVLLTDDTVISAQVSAETTDLVVGSCVTGVASADSTELTQVAISEPEDGSCASPSVPGGQPSGMPSGAGEPPTDGQRPSDLPSDVPTDLPSGMPSDLPSGGPQDAGSRIAGEIVSFDGSSLVVADSAGDESSATLATDVTLTKTASATASAVVAGKCVSAQGESDETGALAAESIRLSDPVDGECQVGGRR